MDNWKGHKEFTCMGLFTNEWEESFRPDFISTFLMGLFVIFILKLILSFTIIITILIFLFKIFLFALMIIANCKWIYLSFKLLIIKHSGLLFTLLKLLLLIIIELLFYYFKLHPFSEKWYYYSNYTCITMTMLFGFISKSIFYY